MPPARRCCLLLPMVLVLAACSTARVNQFKQFAEAGIAYVEAVDALTREAAGASVDADSAILARTRSAVPQDDRARTVLEHNQLLKQRIEILADLRQHAGLLGAYFVSLGAMTDPDTPAEVGDAAAQFVESLGVVGGRLRTARVGDLAVADFTGRVTEIAVANFRQAQLERELRLRAPILERELDLQHAAMQVVVEAMATDIGVLLQYQEQTDVVDPYRGNAKLPKTWAKRRREILIASTAVASADAAALAAGKLGEAFAALAEGRFGAGEYLAVMGEIRRTLDLIAAVRGIDGNG
ncbi:MAG: hypothetical protein E2O40_03070 [Planctomycetota bacterium]|nr:MAG: hypothetical protein E2O40_03070 [Planctomycetota bacterium]